MNHVKFWVRSAFGSFLFFGLLISALAVAIIF